jgi:hypothetical protein
MRDPTDRPPDLSPAELEALLGRGSMAQWQALSAADRNRLTKDLEALQRTAREIANATRQLHDGVLDFDETPASDAAPSGSVREREDPSPDRHPGEGGDPSPDRHPRESGDPGVTSGLPPSRE